MQFQRFLIYSLDMSSTDLVSLFTWYTMLFLLGVAFFPLSTKIFPFFQDKGYGLSKILAVALTSYVVFVLGMTRVIQFHTLTILLTVCALLLVTVFVTISKPLLHTKKRLSVFFMPLWKLLVFEEILFFVSLYFLSYIRAFSPDIHGLEKYMDYGFINSILRSDFFPPADMWFTPLSINYYYFGHLTTALLTKLSGLPSEITYNLMLATIFAMAMSAGFSIGFNFMSSLSNQFIKVRYILALLTAFILTLGGNLHTIYTFFSPYENESPVPPWKLIFQPFEFPNSYWYPNATRFIYNTIHEFPMYSWTVSDLHGHVLDIPYVLLTIGVIYSFLLLFSRSKISLLGKDYLRVKLRFLLFIGLLLSIMYMTNAWDGIIYFLLAFLIIMILEWQNIKVNKLTQFRFMNFILKKFHKSPPGFLTFIIHTGVSICIVGLGFVIFSLPFSMSFTPFVSGIGVLCAPEFLTNIKNFGPLLFEVDHCQHSPLWQILILHGFFYFFVMVYLFTVWKIKRLTQTDVFVCILIILSTFLIIIPEFIYAKDIYPGHYRANTMFKLVFQSFMMFSLCIGFIIFRVATYFRETKKKLRIIPFFFFTVILLSLIFIYPFQAIQSYYAELNTYYGLDGTKYLQNLYPDDYKAIVFIQKSIKGQPVILEAQGDAYEGSSSYTDYSRVSANTGLPTVLGWTVHEWLWRGTYDIPAPRIEEVRLMYESNDIDETVRLLQKYNVEYIFVGQLERDKYPLINTAKFEEIGNGIFENGETKIFRLKTSS